ncbi:unnamed protein product [Bursaphelenchus xylophilus]|uniref:(pine wood nematode) hypothetical protein n=1 Tax=Bursaphelenchus xylophilus TaxID=6326 RepID=A0A1I7SRI1_BURXY|nr:unnamed protein product [Bursaphelenchus xylophilus]CAG9102351.1 unnamed protein product [Bursaphelenchus xylophilus]
MLPLFYNFLLFYAVARCDALSVVSNFQLNAFLNDNYSSSRKFLVDITSAESFILKSAEFEGEFGRGNVFDPTASSGFKNLSDIGVAVYFEQFNKDFSMASGFVGQDRLNVSLRPVEGRFIVAHEIFGNVSVVGVDKETFAGRLGFSKRVSELSTVVPAIYGKNPRILCLEVGLSKNKRSKITTVTVGSFSPNLGAKSLYARVPVVPHPEYYNINVSAVSIGNYNVKTTFLATFTSTFDGITVPESLFFQIVKALDAHFHNGFNEWVVSCGKNLPLKLQIANSNIEVRFDAYTKAFGRRICFLKLRKTNEKTLVLGLPFYVNNGVCFDQEKNEVHVYDATLNEDDRVYSGKNNFNFNGGIVSRKYEEFEFN